MIIKIFQLSFRVFVCAFCPGISSFFGKSFPFLFRFFVLSLLWYLPFHMVSFDIDMSNNVEAVSEDAAPPCEPSVPEASKTPQRCISPSTAQEEEEERYRKRHRSSSSERQPPSPTLPPPKVSDITFPVVLQLYTLWKGKNRTVKSSPSKL